MMNKTINHVTTFIALILSILFSVSNSKISVAQPGIDGNSSEEFFDRGNEQMEKEAQYLETNDEDTSQNNRRNINREIRQREYEAEPLEKKEPEGLTIEDVRSRDVGEDNLPAEPPVNEFKIKL